MRLCRNIKNGRVFSYSPHLAARQDMEVFDPEAPPAAPQQPPVQQSQPPQQPPVQPVQPVQPGVPVQPAPITPGA